MDTTKMAIATAIRVTTSKHFSQASPTQHLVWLDSFFTVSIPDGAFGQARSVRVVNMAVAVNYNKDFLISFPIFQDIFGQGLFFRLALIFMHLNKGCGLK